MFERNLCVQFCAYLSLSNPPVQAQTFWNPVDVSKATQHGACPQCFRKHCKGSERCRKLTTRPGGMRLVLLTPKTTQA
eukprot:6383942-Amphidinium_carterae.1